MAPFVRDYDKIVHAFLGPLRLPRHPLAMARFGLKALFSAEKLARRYFMHERAQALFAGLAAHSIMPLDKAATAAFGLMLGILGHAVGWPLPRGGSQNLANALAAYLHSLGGEIVTGQWIADLGDLPLLAPHFSILPRVNSLHIAGNRLPGGYERRLQRYRYGPGVFKVDWALSETDSLACSRTTTRRNCPSRPAAR